MSNSNLDFYKNPLVEIKGYKNFEPDGLYDKINIEEIVFADTTRAYFYFEQRPNSRTLENIDYFEAGGFYSRSFERSEFVVLQNDSLLPYSGWVKFDNNLKTTKQFKIFTKDFDSKSADMRRGFFVKFKGIIQSGNINGYGHMGGSNYNLYITGIEDVDYSRTKWDYIIKVTIYQFTQFTISISIIYYISSS